MKNYRVLLGIVVLILGFYILFIAENKYLKVFLYFMLSISFLFMAYKKSQKPRD